MICKICGIKTSNRRKTCSQECLRKSLSNGGKLTCDQNRPKGSKHPLWKEIKLKNIRDPFKENCRGKVTNAIRRGKLIRLPCEVCKNPKSEAHHKDYNKPFEIEWLCRIHHRQADYRDGTKTGDFGH